VAAGDTQLNEAGAVQEALTRTILLPPALFPIRRGLYQPVGIGDLLVVKQHLKRYELGEISHIENILQGESKKHTTKHTLTNEQTFVTETEKTTETERDLQTTERFELKSEAENTIKEDTSVKAGVSLSAKYGDVQLSTNTDVAYSNSKTDGTKTSVDKAKDVTSRAVVKVTERVRQQQTIHITENFRGNRRSWV
jgi:predicted glutamine amidotransferase